MSKMLTAVALTATLLSGGAAWATDSRPQHFKGVESADLASAMKNLAEYNQRLSTLFENKTLTPEDLVVVHRLTYTLENALDRISVEVDALAETLELVHVASETAQAETVRKEGVKYLEMANELTQVAR